MYTWEVLFEDSYNNNYIYDYWKNKIYHVSDCFREVRKLIKKKRVNNIISMLTPKFSKEEIVLNHKRIEKIEDSNNTINELKTKISQYPDDFLPNLTFEIFEKRISNTRQMSIEISQSCNMRCFYCLYSGFYDFQRMHSAKTKIISFEIAKKSIDYFFSLLNSKKRTAKYGSPAIGFYGGEALLDFEIVRSCVEYIKSKKTKEKIHFTITTNGTILNEEMIDFFKKNDFSILISLDGPKEEHDKFRVFKNNKGTFDRVWKSILMLSQDKEYFENRVSFASTLSKGHDLLKIEQFFNENFEKNNVKVSSIKAEENTFEDKIKFHPNFQDNLGKLFEKFQDCVVNGTPISRFLDAMFGQALFKVLDRDIHSLDKQITGELKIFDICTNCFPGEKIFVDTDGRFFICERVNQFFATGDYIHGLDFEKIKKIVDLYSKFTLKNCLFCEARRICSLCISHHAKGEIVEYNELCEQNRKHLIDALSKFVYFHQKNKTSMIKNLYKKKRL